MSEPHSLSRCRTPPSRCTLPPLLRSCVFVRGAEIIAHGSNKTNEKRNVRRSRRAGLGGWGGWMSFSSTKRCC